MRDSRIQPANASLTCVTHLFSQQSHACICHSSPGYINGPQSVSASSHHQRGEHGIVDPAALAQRKSLKEISCQKSCKTKFVTVNTASLTQRHPQRLAKRMIRGDSGLCESTVALTWRYLQRDSMMKRRHDEKAS